jgi:endogenous inhibitor of DNA gyrase (YacG/DUF329 family)
MTKEEKELIEEYRSKSISYSKISEKINMSENTIKSYCRRMGITKKKEPRSKYPKQNNTHCKECDKKLVHTNRGKPKKFCSEECRRLWWKENSDKHNKKTYYLVKCQECGKEFESYGNKDRKYCSHSCYIKNRFEGEYNYE